MKTRVYRASESALIAGSKLWQFQCQREGTLFYYQHSTKPSHMVERCPVCGSSRVELTGRTYPAIDEASPGVDEMRAAGIITAELKTEQNTPAIERLIRSAAAERFGRGKARPVFEHGQWYVTVRGAEDDAIFSVVDASPGIGTTGLDFEEC